MLNELYLPGELSLRAERPQDQSFMERLFRCSRPHLELPEMPASFIDALINQQYTLQQNHYRAQWPNACYWVILLSDKAIGRVVVNKDASLLLIVDLVLMPEHRNKRFGTTVLQAVQLMAQKRRNPIRLSVDRQNHRAKKLYLSLGFKLTDTSETHNIMMYAPECG